DARIFFEQPRQAGPKEGLIVDDQHAGIGRRRLDAWGRVIDSERLELRHAPIYRPGEPRINSSISQAHRSSVLCQYHGGVIAPDVCFTNDRYPRAAGEAGELLGADDWQVVPTLVKRGASIGANATIVCGVTIGENSLVGAGSTITRDVAPNTLVLGSPGRPVGPRPQP